MHFVADFVSLVKKKKRELNATLFFQDGQVFSASFVFKW